jgi:hypothetical protein
MAGSGQITANSVQTNTSKSVTVRGSAWLEHLESPWRHLIVLVVFTLHVVAALAKEATAAPSVTVTSPAGDRHSLLLAVCSGQTRCALFTVVVG